MIGPIVLDVFKDVSDIGETPPELGCIPGAIGTAPTAMALPFPSANPQYGDGNVLEDEALRAAVLALGITATSDVVCYSSYASAGSQYGPIAAARMVWILTCEYSTFLCHAIFLLIPTAVAILPCFPAIHINYSSDDCRPFCDLFQLAVSFG